MKKVFFFAAFAAVAFTTQAQVSFGAKAGLNLSTWTGDVEDLKMKPGFYVGGLANIAVSFRFRLQPELLVSAEGAGTKQGGPSLNTMFINIPVMAQYYAFSGFYVEAGPQLGFLLSAKAKLDGESLDIKETLNTTNFAASFGAGYYIGHDLRLGARYNLGLSNASKDGGSKVNTSNISIGLHYKFSGAKSSKD